MLSEFRNTKNLKVLDLAAGSGLVWDLFRKNSIGKSVLDNKNLHLTLVENSEWLLVEAGRRLDNLEWISLHLEDAVSFIENTGDNYHFITAIHFFPILSLNQKKRVIASALQKLKKDGFFFLVQPGERNELTMIKKSCVS